MYYCNAVLLHQCLFSSGRFSSASGLLWTPLDSAPLATSQQRITRSPRPPVHRALPVFHFHFNITILQVCKFASRDSAERIPAVAAQAHNRNPRLVIFYLSLHYFISQTQTLKLSTLNAQWSHTTASRDAARAHRRFTIHVLETGTGNCKLELELEKNFTQTNIHPFIHSFIHLKVTDIFTSINTSFIQYLPLPTQQHNHTTNHGRHWTNR